jgi:ATP-dependent helicase/nuclease subunit B
VDLGTLFHEILAGFSGKLSEFGYHWNDFPEDVGDRLLDEVLENKSAAYRNAVMYETARSQYALERIRRILKRTIRTLQFQFRQGDFEPEEFEFGFQISQDSVELAGRIDRLDISVKDNIRYINVMDYKSGAEQFDINAYYHGLQLQLMTYLYAALQHEEKMYPDQNIVPAGVFYYHLDDPFVEVESPGSIEEICSRQLMDLRLNGLVNSDPSVITRIDHTPGSTMMVLPLSRKTDGTWKEHAMLTGEKDLKMLAEYTMDQMKELTAKMMEGRISLFPYERKTKNACAYCEYAKACGFDSKIPGYCKNILEEADKETILQEIRLRYQGGKPESETGEEEQNGN